MERINEEMSKVERVANAGMYYVVDNVMYEKDLKRGGFI
jgi:hypothetical protein